MTDEEKCRKDAERLREWRHRKRQEYLAADGDPQKKGRSTVPEEVQRQQKAEREVRLEDPTEFTNKIAEEPPSPPLQEVLPPEDAEWKTPAVCEILCASREFEGIRRYATIEQRKPAHMPLRLKIVIFGNTIAELKREARKVGINNFWNYGAMDK